MAKVWTIVILTVVVYLIMAMYAGLGELLLAMQTFKWSSFLLLFLLTTTAYVIRFAKWDFFLKRADVHLELKENLFVFLSGLSMVITPAKVGEVWKGWLIRDLTGEVLGKTVPVVIVDRVTDVLGLALLSLLGLTYFQGDLYLMLAIALIFVLVILASRWIRLSSALMPVLSRRAERYAKNITDINRTFEKTMEPKGLLVMSLVSALGWFFECLALYFVIQGFGEQVGLTQSTFIFSFATLAGAVSMVPGGLGVAEVTISGMLELSGLDPSTSVGVAIITRLGTLWYGAALGISVYLAFKSNVYGRKTAGDVRNDGLA